MGYGAQSFKDMAKRAEIAHANFIETLTRLGEIDEPAAHKVKNLYLRHRIAKLDLGIGRINVKHGAFLDRDVIRRAVAM